MWLARDVSEYLTYFMNLAAVENIHTEAPVRVKRSKASVSTNEATVNILKLKP